MNNYLEENVIVANKQQKFKEIAVEYFLSKDAFYRDYVEKRKPVVIKSRTNNWKAFEWDSKYFEANEGSSEVVIKVGDVSKGIRAKLRLSDYLKQIDNFEISNANGEKVERPGYLHDVPFFNIFPNLKKDIFPFPIDLFPRWYHEDIPKFIQFFIGTTGSLTPLHFDTLYTHNLFFQIEGKKRFILVPEHQVEKCYIEGWRWSKIDVLNLDLATHPKARNLDIYEVILEPGDILFMPSGMLHQVHGLTKSISFNIDWHTKSTALKGVMSYFKGAPLKNLYYNLICLIGITFSIPSKFLFRFYKSYLNYVS